MQEESSLRWNLFLKELGFSPSRGSLRKVCGRVRLRKGRGRDLLESCKSNNIKSILVDAFKCKVAEAVRTKNMKTLLRRSSRKLG